MTWHLFYIDGLDEERWAYGADYWAAHKALWASLDSYEKGYAAEVERVNQQIHLPPNYASCAGYDKYVADNIDSVARECPFCESSMDLDDLDALFPSGTTWEDCLETGLRVYHKMKDTPSKDQRCYILRCGCGAEMHGDTRQEVIRKWNTRKE